MVAMESVCYLISGSRGGRRHSKKNCTKWLHGPNISVAQLTFSFTFTMSGMKLYLYF
jgi:hypothetical protein